MCGELFDEIYKKSMDWIELVRALQGIAVGSSNGYIEP